MSEGLLAQSISITVIGMSVVFVFLLVLVALMFLMNILVQFLEKYFPQAATATAAATATDNTPVAIAIAAARRFQTK